MPEAVIVSAARTPIGRAFKGSLKDVRPDDLAAQVLATIVVDIVRLVDVDRVVLGGRTVYAHHESSMNAIRAALAEGLHAEPWVHVEVMLSTRGTDLIAVGAACEVLEHEYGNPQALVGPGS